MRSIITKYFATTLVALVLCLPAANAHAGDGAAPAQSNAFGKSLTEWMTLYWQWSLGGGPDHVKRVTFLPQPALGAPVSGDFTFDNPGVFVGELEVSLQPGTKFVLPVSAWVGESYLPELGIPDDSPLDPSIFTVADVMLDGKSLIDSSNLEDYYYGPTYFDPPIEYDAPTGYGSNAAIFVQGIGFAHGPLSKGTHTLTLVSAIQVPEFDLGVVFMNTWTITVEK